MNALQNHAFSQLLASWRRREDARQTGRIRDIATARMELDASRSHMRDTLGAIR